METKIVGITGLAEHTDHRFSYVCDWCKRCRPAFETKDEAVTDYLEHQGTPECVQAETDRDFMYANSELFTR